VNCNSTQKKQEAHLLEVLNYYKSYFYLNIAL